VGAVSVHILSNPSFFGAIKQAFYSARKGHGKSRFVKPQHYTLTFLEPNNLNALNG
jgi:hypothetical protein